jgi:hypothetical protein
MPVNVFRSVGIVDYVYAHRHAFFHVQYRSRRGAVVADRADDACGDEFERDLADVQGDIGLRRWCRSGVRLHLGHRRGLK